MPLDLGRHSFAEAAVRGRRPRRRAGGARRSRSRLLGRGQEAWRSSAAGRLPRLMLGRGRAVCIQPRAQRSHRSRRADLGATSEEAEAHREGVRPGEAVQPILQTIEPQADVVFEVPWSPEMRLCIHAEDRKLAFMRGWGRAPAGGIVEERRRLPPGKYVVEVFRRVATACDEWARQHVEIAHVRPQRVRIEPAFAPARTVTGRAREGTTVAWVTRIADGSTFVRDSATPDAEGRLALRGVPTAEILLRAGSILTRVPPGSEPETDIGDPQGGSFMSRFQGFCVSMAAALAMVNLARSQEEEKCTYSMLHNGPTWDSNSMGIPYDVIANAWARDGAYAGGGFSNGRSFHSGGAGVAVASVSFWFKVTHHPVHACQPVQFESDATLKAEVSTKIHGDGDAYALATGFQAISGAALQAASLAVAATNSGSPVQSSTVSITFGSTAFTLTIPGVSLTSDTLDTDRNSVYTWGQKQIGQEQITVNCWTKIKVVTDGPFGGYASASI